MSDRVLLVTPSPAEGADWRDWLERTGHEVVDVCTDLPGMVWVLCRKQVRFVVLSARLVSEDAYGVLAKMRQFFPRVQMILVGRLPSHQALSKLPNVILKSKFDCNLGGDLPSQLHAPRAADALRLLLGEHLLDEPAARTLLRTAGCELGPAFAVLVLWSDSGVPPAVLERLAKPLQLRWVLPVDARETCLLLDRCETTEQALESAERLRFHLCEALAASGIRFSIGVSRNRSQPGQLCACHREAKRAAMATHTYGLDSVIHITYLDKNDVWYCYPHQKEQRLIECTVDGDAENALFMLDEIFAFLEEYQQALGAHFVNRVGLRIWSGMGLAAASRLASFEVAQMDAMSFGKFMAGTDRQAIYNLLRQGVEELAQEMAAIQDVARDVLFTRLSDLRDQGERPAMRNLTQEFHTTIGFLNDAVTRNSPDTIFDFFDEGGLP